MAVDIASGLAYLAEMKSVHRFVECFTFPVQPGMNIVSLTCNVSVTTWAHITLESYHFLSFKLNSLVRTCQKGDEWFPSQETTDSSDLSRMDIHMAMYPCLYSLTISPSLSHYCFCDVWRITWYRLVWCRYSINGIKVTFSFSFRE